MQGEGSCALSENLKIFDFNGESDPSGIVGSAMELGWPCEVYRVTLPKPKDSGEGEFNAFERCILKLLANGRYEPAELAEMTCLPVDLVEVILLKLQDRAKIDDRNQLLPNVRASIEKLDAERESEPAEYETCAIFRECIEGILLPMLVDAKLRSEEINDDRTVGRGHVVMRSLSKPTVKAQVPTPTEILAALRTMARRRRDSGTKYRVPPAEYISVAVANERCWLRVRVVMQRNGDWRILNPMGIGWSPELETVYHALLVSDDSAEGREFNAWQHRNADVEVDRQSQDYKPEPFETSDNISRYPELIGALQRRRTRHTGQVLGTSNDSEELAVQEQAKVDVYAAIEWALFYALGQTDVKRIIQLLGVTTKEDNIRRLREARDAWNEKNKRLAPNVDMPREDAESAQLDATTAEREMKERDKRDDEAIRCLCAVPSEGELRYFVDGEAKMQTVLPLSILAAEAEAGFAFNKLASVCPRFLPKIADLKDRRDPKQHWKVLWDEIYGDEDMMFMRKVVATLLPSIRFSESTASTPADSHSGIVPDDARISARVALQDIFGVSAFMRMEATLQGALISAEMFRRDHSGTNRKLDACYCVDDLYAAVQCAFRPFLVGRRRGAETIEVAAKRADAMGLGQLPVSMRTVRDSMLRRTLDGDDQSLQACVVAWLLFSEDDILRRIASRMPSFLSDVDGLICMRGHGGRRIPMLPADLDVLCKNVYNIIKTLTEV